jgi:hypothetical protein
MIDNKHNHGRPSLAVYIDIMKWLEGRLNGDPKTGNLVVKFPDPDKEGREKTIKFRRVMSMGQTGGIGAYAQSIEDDTTIVYYDPNWEALEKIDALLGGSPK